MKRVTALDETRGESSRRSCESKENPKARTVMASAPTARQFLDVALGSLRQCPQPLPLHPPADLKVLDERRRHSRPVNRVSAPVGTPAVVIGDAVMPGEPPRGEQLSGVLEHVRVGSEC